MIARLDVKFVLVLIATALVPLAVSLYLASQAVDTALAVGLNKDIAEALSDNLSLYRRYVRQVKSEQQVFLTALAHSRGFQEACADGDPRALERAVHALAENRADLVAIQVHRANAAPVRWRPTHPDPRATTIERRTTIRVETCTGIAAVFAIDDALERGFRRAAAAAQAYQALYEAPHAYLSKRIVLVYAILMVLVVLASTAAGVWWTRRIARRIHTLSRATAQVAQGDLDVRVPEGPSDEVGRLIASFNNMVQEIASARSRIEYLQKISTWQDIARRMAHEIKNPLTPIRLAAQQLREKYPERSGPFHSLLSQSVEIILEEVDSLEHLVSEFSSFAKLPDVHPEPGDLAAFLRDIGPSLNQAAAEFGVSVVIEPAPHPCPCRFDPRLMRRVFDNLVRNAAAVMRDCGADAPRCTISCRRVTTGDAGPRVRVVVWDTGPGVPEDLRSKIFDPYYTGRKDGTGLGLAICKKIVLEHRGSIYVDPAVTDGAAFVVELPAS